MFFYSRYRKFSEEQRRKRVRDRRVHLANERTFLAWIRTAIAIMGLGFIVEKFSLFVMSGMKNRQTEGYSDLESATLLGIALMFMGGLVGILAMARYIMIDRQIENDRFQPVIFLDILVACIFLILVALSVFFLVKGGQPATGILV